MKLVCAVLLLLLASLASLATLATAKRAVLSVPITRHRVASSAATAAATAFDERFDGVDADVDDDGFDASAAAHDADDADDDDDASQLQFDEFDEVPANVVSGGVRAATASAGGGVEHDSLVDYSKRSDYYEELALKGNVEYNGIYYVTVGVGTPRRDFKLLFDTGGWNFLIVHRNCTNCGRVEHWHKDESSTSQRVHCHDRRCLGKCSRRGDYCNAHYHFGGGQDFVARVYRDEVSFGHLHTKATIGAIKEKRNHNFAFPAGLDGLIGFGYHDAHSNPTVFQQFVEDRRVHDVFATCLGPHGGMLTLGGIDEHLYTGRIAWTPLKRMRWYVVDVRSFNIGRRAIDIAPPVYNQKRAIIDSGTTFVMLPKKAHVRLLKDLRSNCRHNHLPGVCTNSKRRFRDFMSCSHGIHLTRRDRAAFPDLSFSLANDVTLNLPREAYLYPTGRRDHYCFAVHPARDGRETVIGQIVLQNYYTIYDRRKARAGFATVRNC